MKQTLRQEQHDQDKMLKREFKGVWIPKEVWLNRDLSPLEKFLLVEIDSYEECYASNKYLSLNLGVSDSRISQMITALVKRGYLKRKITYKKDSPKEVDKRFLTVLKQSVTPVNDQKTEKKLKGGTENLEGGGTENIKTPYLESCEVRSTSNRNTNSFEGEGENTAPPVINGEVETPQETTPDNPPPPKVRESNYRQPSQKFESRTLGDTPPQEPPTSEKPAYTKMTLSWQPDQYAIEVLAVQKQIPASFIEDSLAEFKMYWLENGKACQSWSSKFMKSVSADWERHRANPVKPDTIKTKDTSVIDNVTDRSWAY